MMLCVLRHSDTDTRSFLHIVTKASFFQTSAGVLVYNESPVVSGPQQPMLVNYQCFQVDV